MPLWIAAVTVFVGNVPFGYWRGNVRTFSVQWALAIHVPVALAVLMRLASHIPFEPFTTLLMVVAFFTGQSAGQRARPTLAALLDIVPSSCLVCDLMRALLG